MIQSLKLNIPFKAIPVLGTVALSAAVLLGSPKPAEALGACGLNEGTQFVGPAWVSNCPGGTDYFSNTWAEVLVDLPGITQGPIQIMFRGPAHVIREAGNNGVIETTITETLRSVISLPGLGQITLAGNGTGAITDPDSDGFADSFFDVFTEISDDSGNLLFTTGQTPVNVVGDRSLIGVSPSRIIPPGPPNDIGCLVADPPFVEPTAIQYCGTNPVPLFDPTGAQVGFILAENHTVHVPEPSAILGILLAAGMGSMGLVKRKEAAKRS